MMSERDARRFAGKFYGKYQGTVVDNKDEDKRGWLKVKVPAVLHKAEVWARPCLPPGHFFIPDVDETIWVEFEAGDTRHPIWVGVWYVADAVPPEAQVNPPTHRVVHTKAGHLVDISDEDGKAQIVIRHATNSFVSITDDGSVTISNQNGSHLFLNATAGEATLMSEHGHLVTMASGALTIVNDKGAVVELKGKNANVLADQISLSATSVAVGANATSPTIMGTAFKTLWNMVVAHVHPSAMGPTGPGTPPILPLIDGVHLTSSVVVK
jgi:hypothetical protein